MSAPLLTVNISRSRRDGRSANGTLTLRRTSTTPLSQTPQPPASADNAVQLPGLEQSPVAQQTTYELSPARYSKEELLAMSQFPRSRENVSRLFSNGWDPDQVNAGGSRAWGKSNENHVPQEPGACWDEHGDSVPLGLQPLTAEEKEVRSSFDLIRIKINGTRLTDRISRHFRTT